MGRRYFVSDAVKQISQAALQKAREKGSTEISEETHTAILSALSELAAQHRKNQTLLDTVLHEPVRRAP